MQALWMVVASFLFACMGVCVKLSADLFSTAEIVFYRNLISLLLIAGLVALRGTSLRTPHWRFQLVRGVSGFVRRGTERPRENNPRKLAERTLPVEMDGCAVQAARAVPSGAQRASSHARSRRSSSSGARRSHTVA